MRKPPQDNSDPPTQTFVHDRAGNLAYDGWLFYQYDAFCRLVAVSVDPNLSAALFDPNGRPTVVPSGDSRTLAQFEYDGLGRLVRTIRQSRGGAPEVEDYYYDGVRRIQERRTAGWDAWEDPNSTYRDYIWGPGYVDEVLTQISRAPGQSRKVFTYLQDAAYNVIAVLSNLGNTKWQYVYEPYGEVVFAEADQSSPTLRAVNRVGHQGLFFERFLVEASDTLTSAALDPNATGIYWTRDRPYSPRLGRWLARDMNESALPVVAALAMNGMLSELAWGPFSATAHFMDGLNLYQFAGSNPVNRRDPMGLSDDPFGEVDDFVADRTGNAMYWIGTLNSMARGASLGLRTAVSIAWGFLPGSGLYDAFKAVQVIRSGKGGFWEALDIALVAFPIAKKGIEGITALRGLVRTASWVDKVCNCFVAGTLVLTSAGEVPIEQVGVGDVVLTRVDGDPNGPADWGVVTRLFQRVADDARTLTLEDGRSFTVTPEHEMWTFEQGWKPAGDIGVAEHVRGLDDTPLAVIRIDVDPTPRIVYNLEVAGTRTYFAESVWVHNNRCQLSLWRSHGGAVHSERGWTEMIRLIKNKEIPFENIRWNQGLLLPNGRAVNSIRPDVQWIEDGKVYIKEIAKTNPPPPERAAEIQDALGGFFGGYEVINVGP